MPVRGATNPPLPQVIQGGMGVGISAWPLARAVCQTGQLGVVSGTALDIVCARRLQDGDPDGSVRSALAQFPDQAIARWIVDTYFVEGGIAVGQAYRPVPRYTLAPARRLLELNVAANFVEVYLAKLGHDRPVGINYLRKVELPLPSALYGAMLAGVDYILIGAGSPAEVPELVRRLSRHEDVELDVRVMGARSSDGVGPCRFSPKAVIAQPAAPLTVPRVVAIVASSDLAVALAENPQTRPDGFVIEGPSAGGHNAPPRGPRELDERGQPVYGIRDAVDPVAVAALGVPFWLAGSYAAPGRLREALAVGASGVQVGTAFAFCDESGFTEATKRAVRSRVADGSLTVRADWRVSPTGFPFHVAELEGTLDDPAVAAARVPVCDLGFLRSPYLTPDGAVGFRCPAEPPAQYLRKGGKEANIEGRRCVCNALLAAAGFPQRRPGGATEPPIVTAGHDLAPVAAIARRAGRADGGYSAEDVVAHLLAGHASVPSRHSMAVVPS